MHKWKERNNTGMTKSSFSQFCNMTGHLHYAAIGYISRNKNDYMLTYVYV